MGKPLTRSIRLRRNSNSPNGLITLDGSKSISNRVLIIRALSGRAFAIKNLSTSVDTQTLNRLLHSPGKVLDAGHAGTTFRFLTAFLCLRPGQQILTGSHRMKQRPIGDLVQTLSQLGAQIRYLEREGYPPLEIGDFRSRPGKHHVKINASVSSQFISALLMIAPSLPGGLAVELEGMIVSRPYIEMTLSIMAELGIESRWSGRVIDIPEGSYQGKDYSVEADWSAASYFYALAALDGQARIELKGLRENSLQGDSVITDIMTQLGVTSRFEQGILKLHHTGGARPTKLELDFLRCPDLAQTMVVICAALGVPAVFSGLDTLRSKETDRLAALQRELARIGVRFWQLSTSTLRESGSLRYGLEGKAVFRGILVFDTYQDHRMAMSLAPLALLHPIEILDPAVVQKSYPDFWDDMSRLGLVISEANSGS